MLRADGTGVPKVPVSTLRMESLLLTLGVQGNLNSSLTLTLTLILTHTHTHSHSHHSHSLVTAEDSAQKHWGPSKSPPEFPKRDTLNGSLVERLGKPGYINHWLL